MRRLSLACRPAVVCLALLCGAGRPAFADDTVLRLSETATVMVTPDELAASLRAEAAAPNAQDAQRRVNEMVRDAVATAKAVPGINVATGGYSVWRVAPSVADRSERWQAGQTLNLSGKSAEAMLKLVGDLQQKGLAEGSLGWRLSRETERTARKEATKEALSALRGRADEAADVLGLKFASFKEVRLDNVSPVMMPRQQVGMVRSSMAGAAPPPTAEADELPVTASAEADILLKPR